MTRNRANQWKEKTRTGQEITFPSGRTAILKKPDVMGLARDGLLPNFLAATALQGINPTGGDTIKDYVNKTPQAEILKDFAATTALLCRVCFMDPRVVDDPEDEDGILLSDIPQDDQIFVFGYALGVEADMLRMFSGSAQETVVEPVSDVSGIQPAPVKDIWDI